MADYPEIIEVRKEADDHGSNFGGAWHSDVTYLEEPALGSILYAREVPDFGGDTLFANMYLAYDALSDGMRRMLDGMTAVHSARRSYGPRWDWFPTQRAMDAWLKSSPYLAVGIYISGASRGCVHQPNLSARWVGNQLRKGCYDVHARVDDLQPGVFRLPRARVGRPRRV